jgi:hypothetical protein
MTPTTMRNIYVRLALLGIWIAVTAIAAGLLARSNVALHSAYPSAERGLLSP